MMLFQVHKNQKVHQLRIDDPFDQEVKVISNYSMKTSMTFQKEDIVIDPVAALGYVNAQNGWSGNSKDYHPCVQDHDDVLMKCGFIGFHADFELRGQHVNAMVIVHMADFELEAQPEARDENADLYDSKEFVEAAQASGFKHEEIATLSEHEIDMVWKKAFQIRENRQEEEAFAAKWDAWQNEVHCQ